MYLPNHQIHDPTEKILSMFRVSVIFRLDGSVGTNIRTYFLNSIDTCQKFGMSTITGTRVRVRVRRHMVSIRVRVRVR